jgi:hypothetical protein
MSGVTDSLSAKNRDQFTQNLAVFRRDLNAAAPRVSNTMTAFQSAFAEFASA